MMKKLIKLNHMKTKTKLILIILLLISSSLSVKAQSKANDIAGKALGYAALGWMIYNGILSHNSNKPLRKYTPGEDFPPNGYNMFYVTPYDIKECSIHKFEETDSIYYMKMILPSNKENTFYFMFLNKQTADIILDNALNKERGTRKQRSAWFFNFLKRTKYYDLDTKGNNYWIYYKMKRVFTQNNPDAIEDDHVKGMGYLPFNFQRAVDAIGEQNFRKNQWTYVGIAFMLMNSIGFGTPNGKYYYNGEYFNTWEEMDSRMRENGDQ